MAAAKKGSSSKAEAPPRKGAAPRKKATARKTAPPPRPAKPRVGSTSPTKPRVGWTRPVKPTARPGKPSRPAPPPVDVRVGPEVEIPDDVEIPHEDEADVAPLPIEAASAPEPTPGATPSAGQPAASVLAGETDPAARKKSTGATVMDVILGLDLGLLALLFIGSIILVLVGGQGGEEPTRGVVYLNSAMILLMAGIIPFAWVMATRIVPWAGTVAYLGLQRPAKRLAFGVLWGFALIALAVGLSIALTGFDETFGTETQDNPQLEKTLELMTWPLAVTIAVTAAVGEEILFRGLLQKWIGFWGQAVVFGLSHASYGTPLQVIVPFAIALLFGYFVKKGYGILMPMAAHFTYNFVVASSPLWIE